MSSNSDLQIKISRNISILHTIAQASTVVYCRSVKESGDVPSLPRVSTAMQRQKEGTF